MRRSAYCNGIWNVWLHAALVDGPFDSCAGWAWYAILDVVQLRLMGRTWRRWNMLWLPRGSCSTAAKVVHKEEAGEEERRTENNEHGNTRFGQFFLLLLCSPSCEHTCDCMWLRTIKCTRYVHGWFLGGVFDARLTRQRRDRSQTCTGRWSDSLFIATGCVNGAVAIAIAKMQPYCSRADGCLIIATWPWCTKRITKSFWNFISSVWTCRAARTIMIITNRSRFVCTLVCPTCVHAGRTECVFRIICAYI